MSMQLYRHGLLSSTVLTPATPSIALVRQAVTNSTGTQDFTFPGFGTVSAAYFILTAATSDGVAADGAVMSIGATDGTRQWASSSFGADNQENSKVERRAATNSVALITAGGFTSIFFKLSFDSFITDGVRLNKLINNDVGYLLTVILFSSATITAYAGTFPNKPTGASQAITGVGFRPDALLFATNLGPAPAGWNDSDESFGTCMMGFAARSAPITQGGMGYQEANTVAVMAPVGSLVSGGVLQVPKTSGVLGSKIATSDFNSDGFAIDVTVEAFPRPVGFLAFKLTTGSAFFSELSFPTTTGSKSWTGIGFKPTAVFMLPTMHNIANSLDSTGLGSTFGISCITEGEQFCNAIAIEDNVSISNTQSVSDDAAVYLNKHDGSVAFRATRTSFDADGMTFNFTAVDTTIRKCPALFIRQT